MKARSSTIALSRRARCSLRALLLASAALAMAAGQVWASPPAESPPEESQVVARIGSEVITADEFATEMARRGGGRPGQYTSLDQRQALLDEMVHDRLLVIRARQEGLDRTPEVVAALDRVLMTQYTRTRLQPLMESVTVSDAEVRAFFQQNRDHYRTPQRIRGAIIRIDRPQNATEEAREQLAQRVEQLHLQALELPADEKGFGELARQHSDDRATRYTGGILPWLYRGQEYKWGDQVVETLFSLAAPGDVGPVIETEDSYYLVRLVERDESRPLPFESYAPGIKNQLLQFKREAVRQAFYKALGEEVGVETMPGRLGAIPGPPVTAEPTKTPPALPPGDR